MKIFVTLLVLMSSAWAFEGSIDYSRSASGGEGAKLFHEAVGRLVRVTISPKHGYRQDELDGANRGSYLARLKKSTGLKLNHELKTSETIGVTRLDDMAEKTRQFMPWHFKTGMKATGKQEEIMGRQCEIYDVTKSAFLKEGAKARLWITKEFDQGMNRHDFQSPQGGSRVITPLPLSFPVEKGAILKVEVVENGTTVTVVATDIDLEEPEASLFTKPEDYSGPGFPKAPAVKAAPQRKKVDVASLPGSFKNGVGMSLVLVKPSQFKMGSPADEPNRRDSEIQHEVRLDHPFYIATTEVTQNQWKAVMGSDSPSHFKGENLPVEKVTWDEANEFCVKLSEKEGKTYRLPTEAEWECAARAGEEIDMKSIKEAGLKPWLVERAWMSWNSEYKTHEVAQLKPNAWGLYDMLGNVAEWTDGGLRDYSSTAMVDPQGTESEDIGIRGSGWVSGHDFVRFAARNHQKSDKRKSTIGFRVVCEP